MKNFKTVKNGVCAPQGFSAGGIACAIKKSGKKDLGIIYSQEKCKAAAVFTLNTLRAAPIIVSQEQIKNSHIQAVVSNSGNANCATGKQGIKDAWDMVQETAKKLSIDKNSILVTSTGTIGTPLPMDKIIKGIAKLSQELSGKGSSDYADSILTTDLVKKEIAVEVSLSQNKKIKIGGVAKGSGMLHPNMATMHAIITTDADIDKRLLNSALKEATDMSFNMVSVDRCTSTNDCVFLLANGMSEVKILSVADLVKFKEALNFVCIELAKMMAKDGEGATKLIEATVVNAKTFAEAKIAARAVVTSDLFKAAVFGGDPNMGRILSAIGQEQIKTSNAAVWVNNIMIAQKGTIISNNLKKAAQGMKAKLVEVKIDLGLGKNEATAWGCDLTYDYVKINAKYST